MSTATQPFLDSFHGLTGNPPMLWQDRLFGQLIYGKFPSALDLPTGLGKTSVMAIWLVARALAGEDALKAIPRRLVYIVDRRAVVDQATEEAEKLRDALDCNVAPDSKAKHLKALTSDEREKAFATLRALKKSLGFEDQEKLPISTLRGAHVDKREWLEDPAAPAIIVGTVDMIGSRLLFEGYGVSRKMRPYHAGLLGADTLIVLDEAHLVPPFQHLLRAIETKDLLWPKERKPVARFIVLPLSATLLADTAADVGRKTFCLEPQDFENDRVVQRRWRAQKILYLKAPADKWDIALAEQAWARASGDGRPSRVVVFCTRRDKQDEEFGGPSVAGVQAEIEKLAKRQKCKIACELLVGGRRVKERQDAAAQLERLGFAGRGPKRLPGPDMPTFLLATSAGEVGVDFDADHMVCDLAPWERMVQRLGRVNRRGEEGRQAAVVVFDTSEMEKKNEDRKTRLTNTFALLRRIGEGGLLSSEGLAKLRSEGGAAAIEAATTPAPLHPALTRALVDAWSMTSLKQHTGRPDVAPWLRGWVEPDHQTIVIWRTYLPVGEGAADWPRTSAEKKKEVEAFFEAAPVHESEKLETEAYRVADWLQERAKSLLKPQGDVRAEQTADAVLAVGTDDVDGREAATQPATPQARPLHSRDVVLLVLLPDGSYAARYTLGQLAAEHKGKAKEDFVSGFIGKILIVDARIGGLADGLLVPAEGDLPETADKLDTWSKTAGFRVCLRSLENTDPNWRVEAKFVLSRDDDGDPATWLSVEHFRDVAQSEDGRSIAQPQELAKHISLVERNVATISENLRLPDIAVEVLALAALLHDEGKRAARWQRAFRAERDAKKFGLSCPLGKTRGPIDHSVLDGYRHEFGSLAVFEAGNPFAKLLTEDVRERMAALPAEWRDLVLHLIAAHHGQARPVIATKGCKDGPPTALEERAREVALRFARLQKRWGPWGLAWWEALLRAADQQASRHNDKGEGLSALHGEGNDG